MFKKLAVLGMSLSLLSCGLIKEKKPNAPATDVLKFSKPSDTDKITSAQLPSLFGTTQFFKYARGMYNVQRTKTLSQVGPSQCEFNGTVIKVILKVDSTSVYTYEYDSVDGVAEPDYNSSGNLSLLCNSTKIEDARVVKSALISDFTKFLAKETAGSTTSTLYKVGRNLQIWNETKNGSSSKTELKTFEEPNELSVFQSRLSSQSETHNSSNLVKFGSTRTDQGDAFPVETLRAKLQRIRYCEPTATDPNCKDNQDLSSLVD